MIETESILEMASGLIKDQVNAEVNKIIDNILDINTEAKKKRTLTLTIDFLPSWDRSEVSVTATAKSKLLPSNSVQTMLYVGADSFTGELQAVEMTPQIPGQEDFNGKIQNEPKSLKITRSLKNTEEA